MANKFDDIERRLWHIQQRLAKIEHKLNMEVEPPPLPLELAESQPAVDLPATAADIAAAIAHRRNDVEVSLPDDQSQQENQCDIVAADIAKTNEAIGMQPSQPTDALPPEMIPSIATSTSIPSSRPSKVTSASVVRPTITLEQVIGKRGLMIAGIGIFLFGAIFFFKFAIDQGWINPLLRVITGAVVGVAMLGLGEWSLRRGMRQFAAGLIGVGVVLLYIITFIASPNGLYSDMLSSQAAFALMSLVTVIAAAMSLRANMQLAAIVGVVGALATPVLLSTGENHQVVLMTYMMIVEAGFLAIAIWKQWRIVPPLVLAGTIVLFVGWFAKYYAPESAGVTFGAVWAMFAIFWAYGMVAVYRGAISRVMATVLMTIAIVAMGVLNVIGCDLPQMLNLFCIQCLALFVVAQRTALWARWFTPLPVIALLIGLMAWTGLGRIPAVAEVNPWFCIYGWLLVAAGATPLLIRWDNAAHRVISVLTFAVTASIFAIVLHAVATLNLHAFFSQFVAIGIVVGLVAVWRNAPVMLPAMALIFVGLGASWCWRHDISDVAGAVCMYEWLAFLALVVPAIKLSDATGRLAMGWSVAIVAAAMAIGFMYVGDSAISVGGEATSFASYHFYVMQLFVLNAVVLALYWWRDCNWLRLANLFFAAIGVIILADHACGEISTPFGSMTLSLWIWAFFVLFSVDTLSRARLKADGYSMRCDCTITSIIAGAMFFATYMILKINFAGSIGVYAAAIGAALCGLAWLTGWQWRRRALGYAYLSQGLVLLTLAVPIMFDKYAITLGWTCAGVVAMFIYRRLGNPLLLAKSLTVLALAGVHLLLFAIPHDPLMKQAMLTAGGVAVPYGLVLGVAVSAGMFLAAGILSYRNVAMDDGLRGILVALVAIGAAMYMYLSLNMLPVGASQWWWLTLLGGFLAMLAISQSKGAAVGATIVALACVVKYMWLDTLSVWLMSTCLSRNYAHGATVVLNWTFFAGVAIAASFCFLRRMWVRLGNSSAGAAVLSLVAAIPILWVGSFEISGYFTANSANFADAGQAMQMTLSIWWGVYATALLVTGFASSNGPVRYMSLTLFALTIGKVMLLDMRNVQTAYRILTFVALGVLLMAGSWLYNRYFRIDKDRNAA